MYESISNALGVILRSIKVFKRYPLLLIPLIIIWCLYLPVIIYFFYWFDLDMFMESEISWMYSVVFLFFPFSLILSCSILLELIEQLESGRQMSIKNAIKYTIFHNTLKIIPLVIIWTILWLFFLIIHLPLTKVLKFMNPTSGTKQVSEAFLNNQKFSFHALSASFEAFDKGVRMIMFLILPAIAWENLSFWKSYKKGVHIFKSNFSIFLTSYSLTGLAMLLIFLPPSLVYIISNQTEIVIHQFVMVITLIYVVFAWSYSIYLEQLFMAELYLWYHKWENAAIIARNENQEMPSLHTIKKPSLLDGVNDLILKKTVHIKNK